MCRMYLKTFIPIEENEKKFKFKFFQKYNIDGYSLYLKDKNLFITDFFNLQHTVEKGDTLYLTLPPLISSSSLKKIAFARVFQIHETCNCLSSFDLKNSEKFLKEWEVHGF